MDDGEDTFELLSFEGEIEEENLYPNLQSSDQPNDLLQPKLEQKHTMESYQHFRNEFQEQFTAPIRKPSLLSHQEFSGDLRNQSGEIQLQLQEFDIEFSDDQSEESQKIEQQLKNAQMLNLSYFTSKRIQTNVNKSQTIKIKPQEIKISSKQVQVQQQKQHIQIPIIVVFKGSTFFWEFQHFVEIQMKSLQILYDQMIIRQAFIPIFTSSIMQGWLSSKMHSNESMLYEAEQILKQYLYQYTKFLYQNHPEPFRQVLLKIKSYQKDKLNQKKQTISSHPRSSRFNLISIFQGIVQFIIPPKTQLLRKTILQKIHCLHAGFNQCQEYDMIQQAKRLFQKEQQGWKTLSGIDLLLSLQQTESYCLNQMLNSKEQKIKDFWYRYHGFIRNSIRQYKKKELQFICI